MSGIVAYLLLGTNLGDREAYLASARTSLENAHNHITGASSVYETEAWGTEGQPAYLNQVVALRTDLLPSELLKHTASIELQLGRIRRERWASRTIDIDILYYGSEIISQPELEIPHPRLHLRNFTLHPLAEIAPEFVHPVLGKTNLQLLAESPDSLQVTVWK